MLSIPSKEDRMKQATPETPMDTEAHSLLDLEADEVKALMRFVLPPTSILSNM